MINWKSIEKDGLPKKDGDYFFVSNGKYIDVAWFSTPKQWCVDSNVQATYDESSIEWEDDFKITHYAEYDETWMPSGR